MQMSKSQPAPKADQTEYSDDFDFKATGQRALQVNVRRLPEDAPYNYVIQLVKENGSKTMLANALNLNGYAMGTEHLSIGEHGKPVTVVRSSDGSGYVDIQTP